MTNWPAAHHEALENHLAAGLSASQAAVELNGEFRSRYSKNAVIGRAKRTGLALNGRPGDRPAPEKPARKPRTTPDQRPDIAARKAASGPNLKAVPFVARIVEANPENVPLLELADDGCRWASGEGPFTFCNRPQIWRSYCAAHGRLAYAPPQARVRPGYHRSTR